MYVELEIIREKEMDIEIVIWTEIKIQIEVYGDAVRDRDRYKDSYCY